jgi:hypothetical protein
LGQAQHINDITTPLGLSEHTELSDDVALLLLKWENP